MECLDHMTKTSDQEESQEIGMSDSVHQRASDQDECQEYVLSESFVKEPVSRKDARKECQHECRNSEVAVNR